ncbi:hypothetical protein [Nostoc favosum]|uniref:Uncharacterized protein n=1 Tax=Nostoc favosum CHAB5714 TaxID=2780399 RepID=A0ABS8INM7_9NOSO|nr:hypothetical protein [Nostoc favosum]MCC5604927.1 hypothetical protein [Nostoc favosum CHAB5714]
MITLDIKWYWSINNRFTSASRSFAQAAEVSSPQHLGVVPINFVIERNFTRSQ